MIMKKRIIIFLGGILALSLILSAFASAEISISKTAINDVVAKELSQPAKFSLTVTNDRNSYDYFELYTYVDAILAPRGAMRIEKGETKNVELEVYPGAKLRDERKGGYTFVYYVKGQENTVEDRMIIRILPLKDLISISLPDTITTDDDEILLSVENNESIEFSNVQVDINSAFTKASNSFSLGKYEQKTIPLEVDKSMVSGVMAGSYIATVSVKVNNEATLKFEKSITVKEKENIETTEKTSGSVFYPVYTVTKKNAGNIISDVEIVLSKNAFSNSFTSFSIQPDKSEKKGLTYTYQWHATLRPEEGFSVEVTTNYLLPLGILFAIIIITGIISVYLRTDIVIKKKAVRVRSKGGEFAMKVMIFAEARKPVSDVVIRERLPHLAEIYERFGGISPTRVDKPRRIIEWNLNSMQPGEETVLSYIFYSKVSIVGRFELPRALATFKDKKGKSKQMFSNSVYFFEERRV